MRAEPDELSAIAVVLAQAGEEIAQARTSVDAGGTAWLVSRLATSGVPKGLLGWEQPWAQLRLAAEIQEGLGSLVVATTLEQQRLWAASVAFRQAAWLYAETEDRISRALRDLDRAVHDHPETLERFADLGHRYLLRDLLDSAARLDLLTEGPEDVIALQSVAAREGAPPASLVDLIAGDVEVEQSAGLVRVTEVIRDDGSSAWLVQISGTQAWAPRAGENPFDVTTDVRAVAGETTLAAVGVHLALLQAQRASGRDTSTEPVLLSGHSLGGILAATVAADPNFRHGRHVVGVVTAGSPVARVPVPASVSVVALEHPADPVPRLDGRANPRADHWTTLTVTPDVARTAGRGSGNHEGRLHVESAQRVVSAAAESQPQPGWSEVIAPFVRGTGRRAVVHDFTLSRQWQNPRS